MSGGLNPANLVSQIALTAATGGASLYAQLALKLVSAIGQQVIQQLGQQLGLPQSTIDLAQGAFSASVGDYQGAASNLQEAAEQFASAAGASPVEQAEFGREMSTGADNLAASLADGSNSKTSGAGKGGKGSWLMALAEALGKKLDKMADDLGTMADQVSEKNPSMTTKFGAKSQEFGILMNAATTAIKSIGEGLSNSARKN